MLLRFSTNDNKTGVSHAHLFLCMKEYFMIHLFYLFEYNKSDTEFVIQRHQKSQNDVHYDIRIEKGGVLKSWATRKLLNLLDDDINKIEAFPTPDHDYDMWIDFKGPLKIRKRTDQVSIFDRGKCDVLEWEANKITINFKGDIIIGKFSFIKNSNGRTMIVRHNK
jgi:bifunctional non-homologous end joining protein LigD